MAPRRLLSAGDLSASRPLRWRRLNVGGLETDIWFTLVQEVNWNHTGPLVCMSGCDGI